MNSSTRDVNLSVNVTMPTSLTNSIGNEFMYVEKIAICLQFKILFNVRTEIKCFCLMILKT